MSSLLYVNSKLSAQHLYAVNNEASSIIYMCAINHNSIIMISVILKWEIGYEQ